MAKRDSAATAVIICVALVSIALVTLSLRSTSLFTSGDKEQDTTIYRRPTPQPTPPFDASRGYVLRGKKGELFRKCLNLSDMELACQSQLSVKVTNASLEDIVAKVKAGLPTKTRIEVRRARPISVSCDFKAMTAGNVLQSVGVLAGCKLWVFDDRLLISTSENLSASEQNDVNEGGGGEWQRNSVAFGTKGWSASGKGWSTLQGIIVDMFDQQRELTKVVTLPKPPNQSSGTISGMRAQGGATFRIANKAFQPRTLTLSFGKMSPDAKAIITKVLAWNYPSNTPLSQPVIVAPDTEVTFTEIDPNGINLTVSSPNESHSWGFLR